MMEATDPPFQRARASRQRDQATRSRRLILAFVSFAAGLSLLCLGSRLTTSSTVFRMVLRLLLLQCGVLLALLPFFWLLYIRTSRPRKRIVVSVRRALIVDGDAKLTCFVFCCGIMLLVLGSDPTTSRILTPMLQELSFVLGLVLTLASIELFVFLISATCLLETPSVANAPTASPQEPEVDRDEDERKRSRPEEDLEATVPTMSNYESLRLIP